MSNSKQNNNIPCYSLCRAMVSIGGGIASISTPSLEESDQPNLERQLEDVEYHPSHPFYGNRVRLLDNIVRNRFSSSSLSTMGLLMCLVKKPSWSSLTIGAKSTILPYFPHSPHWRWRAILIDFQFMSSSKNQIVTSIITVLLWIKLGLCSSWSANVFRRTISKDWL